MISRFYLFIHCHQNKTLWSTQELGEKFGMDIGNVDDVFVSNVFDDDNDM